MSPDQVLNSDMTVSDKIRALDSAGHPRAEIAKMLNKRYQHVRNVLEGDRLKGNARRQTRLSRASTPDGGRLLVRADGSILVPADMAAAFGARMGDSVVIDIEDGKMMLLTAAAALERVRSLVRSTIPANANLADELVADRRREALIEDNHG